MMKLRVAFHNFAIVPNN